MITVPLEIILPRTARPHLLTQPLEDGGLQQRHTLLVGALLRPHADVRPVEARRVGNAEHVVVLGLDGGLQLAADDHDGQLLEQAEAAAVLAPRLHHPAAARPVLHVFPQGLHAGAEHVHSVLEGEGGEGEVVVDAVEGGDVGDGVGEERERVGAGGGGGLLVVEGVDVLEGERAEFG